MQCAKKADNSSRSREGWRLGTALMQAGRLDEAEALFKVGGLTVCQPQALSSRLACAGSHSPSQQEDRTMRAACLLLDVWRAVGKAFCLRNMLLASC